MSDLNLNSVYSFLLEIIPKCGRIINNAFHEDKNLKTKCSFADLVTETDEQIERVLRGMISERYPNHKFIGEESTSEKIVLTDEPTWIIDPVDGTINFVHKYPFCCISIALFINKKPKVAVVYNPINNELFSAIEGQGSYLNGKTLVSSKQDDIRKTQLITEFGSGKDPEKLKVVVENMHNIIGKVHSIRCLGSCALNICYIANGAADAYYEFGIHCWDIAAAMLIATEAGCLILDPIDGAEIDVLKRRVLCATTRQLADQLIPLIKPIEFEQD